mgnify:FL=1
MDGLDEITLTGLRVFGRHGVFDFEREQGQHFVIDVVLRLRTADAARSDDVRDTVHYGEVAETIVAIVAGEPVNLIETLAERIAAAVLADSRLASVRVTVHKPGAPIDAEFSDVSVSIERSATDTPRSTS